MSKVEELRLLCQCGIVEPDGEAEDWTEEQTAAYHKRLQALDDLIQAVRDEEFEKHKAASQSHSCCQMVCPDDCPANGTRYCDD